MPKKYPIIQKPVLSSLVKRLEDFPEIEEVTGPSEEEEISQGGEIGLSEITEVTDPSEEGDVIEGGEVCIRTHITAMVLSVWTIWNIVGLIEFARTGNTMLLISSPAVMSVPLHRVLSYHFSGGN